MTEVAVAIPRPGGPDPPGVSTEQEHLPYPDLAPVVLGWFKQTSRPRNWCLKIALSPWLDCVSTLVVLLNCLSLGMHEPGDERSSTFQVVDSLVVAFFVLEMLVKMLAKGCFGYQGSYLGNRWHRLDLFINCGVLFGRFMENVNFHFQICRVLGPMRLVSRVTSIRDVFTVLVDIFPMLANVLFLYLFVVHIFGVMGVQLWAGLLRNRCFLPEDVPAEYKASLAPYYTSMYDDYYPYICSTDKMSGMRRCRDLPPSVENGQACTLTPPGDALGPPVANACVNWNTLYNICRAGDLNPSKGSISFDNIGYAWIAIFQVITMEGWTNIMFYVMDAYSFWCFVFFVIVAIMGSFIMMNVCAVVIATQFSDNLAQINERDSRAVDSRAPDAASISGLFAKLTGCLNGIGLAASSYLQVLTNRRRNRVDADTSIMVEICTPFSDWMLRVVRNKIFDRVIIFAVFLSILAMAAEHHDQPKELTSVLRISNNILTVVFVVEMVFKLVALRWLYFKDTNNLFDFFIVIISLWETITKASGRLSVLRVLRFGRMIHFFPLLKEQLLVLKRAMVDAAPLCLIMLFAILLFSLIGRQLFGDRFDFKTLDGDPDRKNFDTLLWSMVTVFQILTEEDWNLVLYNTMEATSPWAAIYFVAVLVTGKHVLLNVLVGIVIQGFQDRSTEEGRSDRDSSRSAGSSPADGTPEDRPEEGSSPTNNEDTRSLNRIQKALRWCKEHEDWSFYMFSPKNRLRIFCQRVIVNKIFNYTVLLFIVLNCITIAMERPGIQPGSTEQLFLKVSSYIFSAVFLVEMLFKVLALGLLVGTESYCRSGWNVMDGSLVILSFAHILVSLFSKGKHKMLGVVKVLRLLRTFRPLRVVKRAPKLKLAVEALIAAVKPIGNITLICCAFIFFYAILGVKLFNGKFDVCIGEFVEHVTNKTDCLSANYRWQRKFYNFDNVPQALMALFAMYSKDGWVNIMYSGLDAVGVDQQPVMNHNEWVLLYFIPFMIMSFFLLDMFIGVMVDTFHQCQQKQKRLDEAEGTTLQARGRAVGPTESEATSYLTSYSRMRRRVHALCTSRFLDLFMAAVIGMSVMIMALEHYGEPQYITQLTECFHYVFTLILIVEVLLKVVAFGGRRFLQNSWNQLDLVVIFFSVFGIVVTEMKMTLTININPSILRVGRVLKLAQVLKAEKIRVLLTTVMKTLAQVGNICLLFIFFFYVYAALGVELFGELECVNKHLCRGLNDHVNFENFGIALLALFQVCTGDNWSVIMKDTMTQDRRDSNYLLWVSPIFFISFVIMAQFVLVNLVVAVIMQAMEDSKEVKEERVAAQERVAAVESPHQEDRL